MTLTFESKGQSNHQNQDPRKTLLSMIQKLPTPRFVILMMIFETKTLKIS